MSSTPDKRTSILASAEIQFSRYGFRRTSMDDIARETGISRASLYSYFENKEDIFRGVCEAFFADSFDTATREMRSLREGKAPVDVVERFFVGLCAFYARFYGVLESTPHGDEIIEASKLGADIANVYATRKDALLEQELEYAAKAGEIDLNRANCSAAELAQSIRLAAGGLKQGAADFADYQKKLKGFLPVIFAGLRLD